MEKVVLVIGLLGFLSLMELPPFMLLLMLLCNRGDFRCANIAHLGHSHNLERNPMR